MLIQGLKSGWKIEKDEETNPNQTEEICETSMLQATERS